jgi:hypothetical protein
MRLKAATRAGLAADRLAPVAWMVKLSRARRGAIN